MQTTDYWLSLDKKADGTVHVSTRGFADPVILARGEFFSCPLDAPSAKPLPRRIAVDGAGRVSLQLDEHAVNIINPDDGE